MNLSKSNIGDWDVLTENTNMIIGDSSEDYGWNLTFFFGEFGEYVAPVIVVGKPHREEIVSVRVKELICEVKFPLGIPLHFEVGEVESSLGIPIENLNLLSMNIPLGIPVYDDVVKVERTISYTIYSFPIVEVSMTLKKQIKFEIPISILIGNTLKKSKSRLRKLKEFLEKL